MSVKKTVSALFVSLFTAGTFAQSMVVDMDTASGIQAAVSSKSTGQILTVHIRITGAVNLFSYQCKVAFDTSRLTFMDAQLDGGFTGEKNILSRNGGGTPIGVRQLQQNPPAADTVEFGGSITGTDPAKSVSGDGLAGIVYFTSKTAVGDSCAITVSSGFTAPFGGDFTAIGSYSGGKYRVVPPVSTVPNRAKTPGITEMSTRSMVVVTIGTSGAVFEIPREAAGRAASPTFRLFTADGRLVLANPVNISSGTSRLSMAVPFTAGTRTSGVYIGCIDIGGKTVSQTISFK